MASSAPWTFEVLPAGLAKFFGKPDLGQLMAMPEDVAIKAAQYAPLDKKYGLLAEMERRRRDLNLANANAAQGVQFRGAQQGLAIQEQLGKLQRINQGWVSSLANDAASQRSGLKINEAKAGTENKLQVQGAAHTQDLELRDADTRNTNLISDNTTENLGKLIGQKGVLQRMLIGDLTRDEQLKQQGILDYSKYVYDDSAKYRDRVLEYQLQQNRDPLNRITRFAGNLAPLIAAFSG